jgi:large subunit ribosomal protein L17
MNPWLVLIIIVVVIFIVWWALLRNASKYKPDFEVHGHAEEHGAHEATAEIQPAPEAVRTAEVPAAAIEANDLTLIEGIGPKVNQLLQQAGIHTFGQLAQASAEGLKAILEPAGLQFIDPTTWPEQARLLSEGKMEAFEELTKHLKGGRRVD